MSGLITGISVTVALLSAISLMGSIGFIIEKNVVLNIGAIIVLPLAIPVITRVFLPFYHRLPITTSYEYLEQRFNTAVRSSAGVLFILMRGFFLAVVVYAPSLALAVVTGWPIYQNILLMGSISIALASLGGMRGVVWAEVVKFVALAITFSAILIVLFMRIDGGFIRAWEIAYDGNRLSGIDWSWNPEVTFSFWWILIGTFCQVLSSTGADQISVQRYLTSGSIKESRKAVVLSNWLTVPIHFLLMTVGVGMYAFYQQHPEWLKQLKTSDYAVPHFAVHQLPPGLSGAVIFTILLLSFTTLSSGLHSINTVVMSEIFKHSSQPNRESSHYVRVARVGTVFWGIAITILAFYISKFGIIIVASRKILQFFGGVILGIFLLGILFRRTNTRGALLGAAIGMATVSLVGRFTSISFFLYAPIGCLATISSGYLGSLIFPTPKVETIRGLYLDGFQNELPESARASPQGTIIQE